MSCENGAWREGCETALTAAAVACSAANLASLAMRANAGKLLALALPNDRMAGVAVVCNRLAGVANMLAVVAPEAPRESHMADVVRVGAPTDLHLREEIIRVHSLRLGDGLQDSGAVRERSVGLAH